MYSGDRVIEYSINIVVPVKNKLAKLTTSTKIANCLQDVEVQKV